MTADLEPRRDEQGRPVMRNGLPNPTGTGRYCLPPPGTCYCGSCPWWVPRPPVNYSAALRALAEQRQRKPRKEW